MRLSRSLLARGLASVGILALLFVVLPWAEFQTAIDSIALRHWVTGVGIFLAMHGLGAMKWRLLINAGRGNLTGEGAGGVALLLRRPEPPVGVGSSGGASWQRAVCAGSREWQPAPCSSP